MVGRAARLVLAVALTGCAIERPAPPPLAPDLAPPPIMAGFGRRHAGIDLRAAVGAPVLAAADGIVRLVADRPRAGRMVVLGHGPDLATVYMHLSRVTVRVAQAVHRGEPIGLAGMTGNATTPHLHFGVCRRPGGSCGATGQGWDDPARYWIEGDACYAPGRHDGAAPGRLTYPLPCAAPGQRPAGVAMSPSIPGRPPRPS